MKAMYRMFHDLDVDDCLELPKKPFSELEIKLVGESEPKPLAEFLGPSAQLVTLDRISSKALAEEMTKRGFEQYAHLYIDIIIEYAVFRHDDKAVGYGQNVIYYNGYPTVLKEDDFRNFDPVKFQETFNVNKITSQMSEEDTKAEPVRGVIPSYCLLRDFLKQNPIYLKTKKWGITRRELWNFPPPK